jgi:hypothetical protein
MMDFEARATEICEHFYRQPSTQLVENSFKSAIQNLVFDLYAEGGYILDYREMPIVDVEDVDVIVDRGPYSLNAVAIRRFKLGVHNAESKSKTE